MRVSAIDKTDTFVYQQTAATTGNLHYTVQHVLHPSLSNIDGDTRQISTREHLSK